MEPTIGGSLREGLRAANRSWVVMAVVAGCWVVIFGIVGALVLTTKIPVELLQESEPAPSVTAPAPAATPQPAAPSAAPSASASVAKPSATSPASVAPPAVERDNKRERLALEWIERAWPVLGVCVALFLIAGAWLQGAQLGYLAKRIAGEPPTVADFFRAGTRAFGPLLSATLLSLAVVAGMVGLLGLVGALLAALSHAVPAIVLGLLLFLVMVALVVGFIWLGVRIAFWFIVIVADALGPLQGLNTAFRITRGRWWKILGFTLVLGAIAVGLQIAAALVSALLNAVGGLAGGPIVATLFVIGRGIALAVNLFAGFAILGAYIRYYKDLGGAAVSAAPATATMSEQAS